jgi:hypothetical protein
MRKVRLWGISGAALIVPEKTGIVYTNQVGGTACFQKELEGFVIPLNNDCLPENHEEFLESYLGTFFETLTSIFNCESANNLNKLLWNFPETTSISVDKSRVKDSMEAWVYVDIKENSFSDFSGFGKLKGVLTWCNSD